MLESVSPSSPHLPCLPQTTSFEVQLYYSYYRSWDGSPKYFILRECLSDGFTIIHVRNFLPQVAGSRKSESRAYYCPYHLIWDNWMARSSSQAESTWMVVKIGNSNTLLNNFLLVLKFMLCFHRHSIELFSLSLLCYWTTHSPIQSLTSVASGDGWQPPSQQAQR
jgi:hypothetical protein